MSYKIGFEEWGLTASYATRFLNGLDDRIVLINFETNLLALGWKKITEIMSL